LPPGFDSHALDEAFTYHKPSKNQQDRLVSLRAAHRLLAQKILDVTPGSPEQTLAIRSLEECSMWANKSIALEPPGTDELRPGPAEG
jgi:hypothetical protein